MSALHGLDGVLNDLTSTRRQFLKRAVTTAAAPISVALLAACGTDDDEEDEAEASAPATETAAPTATTATGMQPTSTEAGQKPEPTVAEPAGTMTAETCPSDQYPTVGALGISDGAVRWSVCAPDEAYRTVIGASADIVLVEESGPMDASGAASQYTIAFDAADGSERWRRSTGHAFTPAGPIDGQGLVVLADQDAGALVGLDVATGEEQWRVDSSEAPLANSPTVAVVWDVVSPGSAARFRGIDRATGDELWVSDTQLSDQSGVFVARSPAAVLGEVIVVPTGATVTAVDMPTGELLWQGSQLHHLAAADGTIVGMGGTTGRVTALDAASGEELWTAPGSESYGGLLAVGDGVIAVFDPGNPELVAYELSSGNERWRVSPTSAAEPQLISGASLVMLWEGELAVLSTTDGATLWSATEPFGSPLMNSAASNGDAVFVAINSLPWSD